MIILSFKEINDSRVALTPNSVKKLLAISNVQIYLENNYSSLFSDEEYISAGVIGTDSRQNLLKQADMYLGVYPLPIEEISQLKKGALHISHFDPFQDTKTLEAFISSGVSSFSMEMIPRTTIAQKMDALSSQASLAGYVAVIEAAKQLNKILPMMMTPAGTIPPSRVFVIGAGVAGLQAIATAKRLGARVDAFDTRPVVEEQVISLGAKFLKIDLGETGETKDGYAKQLTEAQLEKQKKVMDDQCSRSDIVITTAKLFGKKSPILITKAMLKKMATGSIVVDLAVSSGGNVEGSEPNKITVVHGVTVIGIENLPGEVAINASEMYASNLVNLLQHLYNEEKKEFTLEEEDPIVKSILITQDGKSINQKVNDSN